MFSSSLARRSARRRRLGGFWRWAPRWPADGAGEQLFEVRPVPALRHRALKPELTRPAKQIRPDLALLQRRNEDAVRPPRQEPRKVGLAHRQREAAQIVAVQNSERNRALVRRHEVFLPSRRKVLDLLEFQD